MRSLRPVVAALLASPVLWSAGSAAAQECSCTDKDPDTFVELRITATESVDHSRIGPDQAQLVVDLRGERTELVGDPPAALAGVALDEVPVLMVPTEDRSGDDECSGIRPAVGADLSLTGHVYMEETGPTVWTGPCQGTLTVIEAAAAAGEVAEEEDDAWTVPAANIAAGVLGGSALVCLAVALVTGRRTKPPADPNTS